MPILNFRFIGETSDGKPVPGAIGLRKELLRIPVQIGLHHAAHEAIVKSGEVPPKPIVGRGIIDTGASITAIDVAVAKKLTLEETGTIQLGTASGPTAAPTYAFKLILADALTIECTQGAGCNLGDQNIILLLGMDVLSNCILILNGPDGSFNLAH